MTAYCSKDSPAVERRGQALYSLYGITNHFGGLGGGHYTAHCRHPTTGKWLLLNDGTVSPAEGSFGGRPEAYVLFYRKMDTPAGDFVDL